MAAASIGASTWVEAWASVAAPAISAVRSSTWSAGVPIMPRFSRAWTPLLPHASRPSQRPWLSAWIGGPRLGSPWPVAHNQRLDFLEPIADAVKRLNHIEFYVACLELFAQPLDVTVDGSVVYIHLVVVGRIHQCVAAFHHPRAAGQRLQNEKLGDRERHRLVLPGAGVAFRVHAQQSALQNLAVGFLRRGAVFRRGAAQNG